MTVPTVAVTCRASVQNGPSIAGATFTAKLNQTELYNGLVAPAEVSGVTDVNGVLVLQLFPNVLGSAGSLYKITGTDPSGRKFLRANASVPNAACDLMNILTDLPPPVADVSTQAAASARASRDAAALSEASAANSAAASEVSATNSLTRSQNAATSQVAAAASANSALVSLNEFKGRSYGPLAADPTLDPLGAAPTVGDEYFNTVALATKRYNGTVWVADISRTDLAASGGAGLSGFDGSLNYATGTIGARLGSEINIKDFPWNCKCDNATDDTAGFHAALAKAILTRGSIFHPGGICRITSGYTNSLSQGSVLIRGNGVNRESFLSGASSVFQLDSTSPTSFFFTAAVNQHLQVRDITFSCKQYVLDRRFFIFSSSLHIETFENVNFETVEKPICYTAGSYFQNSSFTNVQFRNSGTFHSESSALVGTLLMLNSVNHEGSVPINTEKVVCNLQGMRWITGFNVLLEGSLPEAGWTVLKMFNAFNAPYTRTSFANFTNYWTEWSGAFPPLYQVDQISGTASFSGNLGLTLAAKYKLSQLGRVIVERMSFIYTLDEVELFFEKENDQCVVDFNDCGMRGYSFSKIGFNHRNSQILSITNGVGQATVSNTVAAPVWSWNGGFPAAQGATHTTTTGSFNLDTDAIYARKLVMTPAAGLLSQRITVPIPYGAGTQVMVLAKIKLPTFASGLWRMSLNTSEFDYSLFFNSTQSGQVVDVVGVYVATVDNTVLGMNFGHGTTPGATGGTNLELYSLDFYIGKDMPRRSYAVRPANLLTAAAAMPTIGGWVSGDLVKRSPYVVGQPKGWARITTGAGNVLNTDWVSEGVL